MDPDLLRTAEKLLACCREEGLTLATAESCTGGMISAALTEIAGSSDVVDRGFVTYSNEAKREMLGVPAALLDRHGAVSEEVARAMAEGGMKRAGTDLCVAVTGIAGPGGGSADKPVGLVHFAAARDGAGTLHRRVDFGDLGRAEVRRRSVAEAFSLLEQQLDRQ
ncbi:MAG: CinA family protein [Pseudomonadota bacterium]|nr:CinA family protein [Pseudomonadota bacterium]